MHSYIYSEWMIGIRKWRDKSLAKATKKKKKELIDGYAAWEWTEPWWLTAYTVSDAAEDFFF